MDTEHETERAIVEIEIEHPNPAITAQARLPQLTHDCDDFSSFDSRNSLILLSPIFVIPL